MCSNCNKNPAVVYFSSGSEKKHLCIPCAKAAGIPLPEGFPQSEEAVVLSTVPHWIPRGEEL